MKLPIDTCTLKIGSSKESLSALWAKKNAVSIGSALVRHVYTELDSAVNPSILSFPASRLSPEMLLSFSLLELLGLFPEKRGEKKKAEGGWGWEEKPKPKGMLHIRSYACKISRMPDLCANVVFFSLIIGT